MKSPLLLQMMQATSKGDAGDTLSPARANCILEPEAMKKTLLMLVLWSLQGGAQDSTSLKDAVHLALEKNKSMEASVAAQKAAESHDQLFRILDPQRQSGLVSSSLLTQHQFGAQNFQVASLNQMEVIAGVISVHCIRRP